MIFFIDRNDKNSGQGCLLFTVCSCSWETHDFYFFLSMSKWKVRLGFLILVGQQV